ncbi:hypothetical protein INN71_08830 [Nocardioides sp. ChNu-153]|uniref:hypothetical protein n=1 Tax=Nocardioides sp. ChNu-153 TaxID=2779364 RepID=UPI0026546D76|nr:hypothetical protein [Nocardioides sp. ChNu-153]MDN7121493.1 hypothetical protein [Nocardioides sp. ChNu-153]
MTTSTLQLRRRGAAVAGGTGLAVAASLLSAPLAGAAEPVQGDLTASYGRVDRVSFVDGVEVAINVSGAVPAEQGGAPIQVFAAPSGLEDALAAPDHRLPAHPGWSPGRFFPVPSCAYTDPQRDFSMYVAQPASPGVEGSQVELPLPEVDETLLQTTETPRLVLTADSSWRYQESAGPSFWPGAVVRVVPEGVASWCGTMTKTDDLLGRTITEVQTVLRSPRENDPDEPGPVSIVRDPYQVPAGPHQATFTLDTDGRPGDGLTVTHHMQVDRGQAWVGSSFVRTPTPRYTGLLRVQGLYTPVGPTAAPQPGRMTVTLLSGRREIWYSGIVQSHPRTVDNMFRLPNLPRGTYSAVIHHRGNSNVLPSTVTRTFTVR